MWSTIPLNALNDYENKYPQLIEFDREYILYSTKVHAFLPRHFHRMYPHPALQPYEDKLFKAKEIDIKFNGELRENQVELFNKLDQNHPHQLEGIIKAFPGFGKTISACYLTSQVKTKTLIVLDNSKLLEQWIEAFTKFTTIKEEDIGLIKGKKMELDKPVVIAMVQTMLSKIKRDFIEVYKEVRAAGFGLAVYDECHKTSSASKYATSSLLVNAPNMVGLSATPYHTDLAQVMMSTTIGPILYETKAYEISPNIYFIKYNSGLPQKTINKMNYFRDFIKQKSYYDKVIVDSEKYLYIIHRLVARLIEAEHQTFIVCSTVKQVQVVHSMLSSLNIPSDMLYSKDTEVDASSKVIIATYSYAGTGFDLKSLSALIYASPYRGRKSLIQTIGRILRKSEGKDKAVVFDLIDTAFPKFFKGTIESKKRILRNEFADCIFQIIDY